MSDVLLNILGPNRTGIVAEATRLLFELGVNISDSSMSTLRSEFAMMMVLQLPDALDLKAFENALQPLRNHGLSVYCKALSAEEASATEQRSNYALSVIGRDQTGLIYHFSEALAQLGGNISEVSTQALDRQHPPLYAMIFELYLPAEVQPQTVDQHCQQVAQQLGVDAHFHPLAGLDI